ncbi:hypothetical protein HHK36_032862 [Tetracentron sinense]|uniref:C2H2-type domain-containing protein n=1 Tax=Tetracentron sinense TaxID=13715 RepID=A0A835D012_TETSI|nr:hypothetical protein HHK36_032862 [Tetracentron sinense]
MPIAKLTSDTMKPEQKAGKPEKNDSLDNFIRQAIGKEPLLSFSKAGDSPVQWIQLLHALDQQGTNKFSKGSKINSTIEGKERSIEHCNGLSSHASEINGVKESFHPVKNSGLPVKGTKSASEHIPTVKIPEAVVALAQAAAKANGEPEKYLPGWPLMSPKVQMQKCDKCSREFCSPINYRRHIRMHRRSLNIDKDSAKNRDLLGAFWDKLSLDDAKEILSFKNVTLEEVPGSSITRALTSFIRKPGFSSLPQVYIKAGAALLGCKPFLQDLVQARPSRFPISSKELFSILDDASENTFLCAGTAVSMQKFMFDGEAGKIGLEVKNLVACASFLVEQKLVKAWLADKDAEALRCQKLLVEEEEAAQKRQAELLEKRKMKKLRQKAKEQKVGEKADLKEVTPDTLEDGPSSAETSSPMTASDSDSHTPDAPPDPVIRLLSTDAEADTRIYTRFDDRGIDTTFENDDSTNCQNVDYRMLQGSGRQQLMVSRRQLPKPQRGAPNGLHVGQITPMSKLGVMQKNGFYRDHRTFLANGHKVWTQKMKPKNGEDSSNSSPQKESRHQPEPNENQELLLIGSISVTLGDCRGQQSGDILAVALDQCTADPPRRNDVQEKLIKRDSGQNGTNRSMVKLWRPVSRHDAGGSRLVHNDKSEPEIDVITEKGTDRTLSNEPCLASGTMDDNIYECRNDSPTLLEGSVDSRGLRLFSSRAAEAFLAQRWNEAIAADHVKLVLLPETEPPDHFEIQNEPQIAASRPPDCFKRSIFGNAENRLATVEHLEPSTIEATKAKFRAKPEKGYKLKYIPKKRNMTQE